MQKKPITNKLLWIFAIGQFGWSLLSGVITNWMVFYYTGVPTADSPNTGIFAGKRQEEQGCGISRSPVKSVCQITSPRDGP